MDDFTRAYIEAAFRLSNDERDESGGEPLDKNYSMTDLAPSAMDIMQRDAKRFQREQGELLARAYDVPGYDTSTAGHDFWLTRNGHGAGFWDGDLPDEIGQALTSAAHAFGEQDLYVGDDGKVYVAGAEALNEARSGHPPDATTVTRESPVAQDFPTPEDAMHHAVHVGFTHFTHVGKHITLYGPGPDGMSARSRLFYAKGKYHLSKPSLTKKSIPKRAHVIEHEHHQDEHGSHPPSGMRPTGVHEDSMDVVLLQQIAKQEYEGGGWANVNRLPGGSDFMWRMIEEGYLEESGGFVRLTPKGRSVIDPSGHVRAGTRQDEDYYVVVQGRIVEGPFQNYDHASGRASALGGVVIHGVLAQYQTGVESQPRSRYVGAPNGPYFEDLPRAEREQHAQRFRDSIDALHARQFPIDATFWGEPVRVLGFVHDFPPYNDPAYGKPGRWDDQMMVERANGERFITFARELKDANGLPLAYHHGMRRKPTPFLPRMGVKAPADHPSTSYDHQIIIDSSHRGMPYRVYKDYEDPSGTCAVVITGHDGQGWHMEGYASPEAAEQAAHASIDGHPTPGPRGMTVDPFVREGAAREKGVVWLHRPDGVYWANATGGTYWLVPTPGGQYNLSWSGTDGSREDLGMHSLAGGFQAANRHEPRVSRRRQQVAATRGTRERIGP